MEDVASKSDGHITHLNLVRIIDRTSHLSARVRERELEYHIVNDAETDFRFIYLPLHSRVQNLRVYDEDGRRLNVAPDELVSSVLRDLKVSNPAESERFELKFKHVAERVLVTFPDERPLKSGGWRTITFRFEEDFPESDFPTWSFSKIETKLFTLPRYRMVHSQFPGHSRSYQVVIIVPPDFVADWSVKWTDGGTNLVKLFGMKRRSRAFTVRMAAAAQSKYDTTIDYVLVPQRKLTAFVLTAFFFASLIVSLSALALFVVTTLPDVPSFSTLVQGLLGGLAATKLAMINGFREEWVERYKLLLLGPLVLEIAALIVWSV